MGVIDGYRLMVNEKRLMDVLEIPPVGTAKTQLINALSHAWERQEGCCLLSGMESTLQECAALYKHKIGSWETDLSTLAIVRRPFWNALVLKMQQNYIWTPEEDRAPVLDVVYVTHDWRVRNWRGYNHNPALPSEADPRWLAEEEMTYQQYEFSAFYKILQNYDRRKTQFVLHSPYYGEKKNVRKFKPTEQLKKIASTSKRWIHVA